MGNMTPFDLDSWLERELRDRLGSPAGPSPLPAQSRYHAGYLKHAGSTSRTGRVKALASKQAAGALDPIAFCQVLRPGRLVGSKSLPPRQTPPDQ